MTKKKLKKYQDNMDKKLPEPMDPIASGIACTELKCKGEMMIVMPVEQHPELPLRRAKCEVCGWRGWV